MADEQVAAEDEFPVDSLREAARHLRRPFHPNAIKFKIQNSLGPNRATIVAYIDARLAIERLNLVCPHLWHDEYRPYGERVDSGHLICDLTIDGITRSDVGAGQGNDKAKAAFSDALKRAAVHFGIGVSLYAMPRFELAVTPDGREDADGNPTLARNEKNKPLLTAAATRFLRTLYAEWLRSSGEAKFGKTLDHGDAPEAAGDPIDPEAEAPADGSDDLGFAAEREALSARYEEITQGDVAKRRKLKPGQWNAQLEGARSEEDFASLAAKLDELEAA